MPVAVAHQRTLAGAAATLRADFLDGDGDLNASPGTVTVGVVDAAGTEVLAAGTATSTPTDKAWRRTVALTASQTASVARLTATWTVSGTAVATTVHEIVGGYWYSLAQLRAVKGLEHTASDALVDARAAWEHLAEEFMGVAWVPRFERETVLGTGSRIVVASWSQLRTVSAITVDAVAQTVADWDIDYPTGVLRSPTEIADGVPIIITYTHGYSRPDPALSRVGLVAVRHALIGDTNLLVSPRARSFSNEAGTVELTYAGRDHPTGLAEVDALLMDRSRRVPGVA